MVSDSELVGRLREFLSTSDLTTTTRPSIRRQLEQDFEIDLKNKKAFIREQVDLYLESQQQNEEDEEEEAAMAKCGDLGTKISEDILFGINFLTFCVKDFGSSGMSSIGSPLGASIAGSKSVVHFVGSL
ncbi:DEK, C-terminal [Cynara cardunculus var. scolymus]|uniref:DEK, C-terminal n=1 Tax=Cynara cardunculus var. scolymus TaxID=59895 RepID=A0A103UMQ9_CYNCS|nr:DEK, C-terminal [Cynara cardunculus var. scolymus]